MTTLPLCKKTKKMLQAEALAGKPLEEALPELLNVHGYRGTARYLHTTPGALAWWLVKFHIRTKFVAFPEDSEIWVLPKGAHVDAHGINLTEVGG